MPGPGLKRHEAVGLGRGGVDHLPDVDAHAVAEDRQLVDERDVHRAEDVLEQLGQLRRLAAWRPATTSSQTALVELDRAPPALVGQAADDLGRVAQREVGAARVDALGREGQVEVAPRGQAGLLQQRPEALARRARVGGRLEHDELALLEHVRQRRAGVDQRLEVRLAVVRSAASAPRRRPRRPWPGRRSAAWRGSAPRSPGASRPSTSSMCERPSPSDATTRAFDVDAHHLVPRLREGDDQRQAHVSEPDDPDLHRRPV